MIQSHNLIHVDLYQSCLYGTQENWRQMFSHLQVLSYQVGVTLTSHC